MKTLTGPKSTPRQSVFQRGHSHGMWLENPPVHSPSPKQNSLTTEQIRGLTSSARMLRASQRQTLGLCVVGGSAGTGLSPSPFTCQWSNQSSSDPGSRRRAWSSQVRCFVLLPSPQGFRLESLGCQQALSKPRYEGFVTLFKPWAWVNTSAVGRQSFQTIRRHQTGRGECFR